MNTQQWLIVFILGVVTGIGCVSSDASPTHIIALAPTETNSPTVDPQTEPPPTTTTVPTQSPPPTPTPIPTLEPRPARQRTSNLVPFTPPTWILPLLATDKPGVRQVSELSTTQPTYISWAAINNSPTTVDYTFYVDVFLDDVFVERWAFDGIEAYQTIGIMDWDQLSTKVSIQPGSHLLKLIVDSTNLIPEIDESDNFYELEFSWSPPTITETAQRITNPTKLPDLVLWTPNGWTDSLIATSYSGAKMNGPLSVDVPTYIRYSIRNNGLASIASDIWTHIYLDDILVTTQLIRGPLAEETLDSSEWAGLSDVVDIIPGVHTLRIEVDATNLVTEGDEENNSLEKEFTWATGPVPARPIITTATKVQPAIAPEPLTLPNLVPGWRMGWDGPIIISHQSDTFLDSPMTVGKIPLVDLVIHNESVVAARAPFDVDLYFDGGIVHTFTVSQDIMPNQIVRFADWNDLPSNAHISAGIHTLKMNIDPHNQVKEANEDDNTYHKAVTWMVSTANFDIPTMYSNQELMQKLTNLKDILDNREPALRADGPDHTKEVSHIADAGYYMLTGRSILDERVDIYLLDHFDHLSWIDDHYAERLALSPKEKYEDLLSERDTIKSSSAGLTVPRFGKLAVVVNAERPVADVIGTLVHELGHVHQAFLNPSQTYSDNSSNELSWCIAVDHIPYHKAVREAEAQQFERAFWLKLQAFTGLELLRYPVQQGFKDLIEFNVDLWYSKLEENEHFIGYMLQWLAVLDDPELLEMKQELTAQGELGEETSLELYHYLVDLPAELIQTYVSTRFEAIDKNLETIKALSRYRLIQNLHQDEEGSPALRDPGLLTP